MSAKNEMMDSDLVAQVVAMVVAQMGNGNMNTSPSDEGETCLNCGKAAHRPGTKVYARCNKALAAQGEDVPEEGERSIKGAASAKPKKPKGQWKDVKGTYFRIFPKEEVEDGFKVLAGRTTSPEGESMLSVKQMVKREKDDAWWHKKNPLTLNRKGLKTLITALHKIDDEWE